MNRYRSRRLLVPVLALGLVLLWGCRRQKTSDFDDNFPPETYISRAPAESTLAYYHVHLYWSGSDADGSVDHYEYAVTDTSKVPGEDTPGFFGFYRTSRTDSVFILSADNPQVLGHRFYVRAVDNEGKVDPTPAWAYFVAHDYNFPNVVFREQVGWWEDRDGEIRTIDLRSSSRFQPTDTIGVGGGFRLSWSGFDVDDGGYVVGYNFRTTDDFDYRGGSLADTSIVMDFAPTTSGGFPQYFSGAKAVQVRAIDDAGAMTQPDSVRSVVVNFSPVTWIVDPDQTSPPVRRKVFREVTTGAVYPSGTTLAMNEGGAQRGIEFLVTGFDDPREKVIGAGANAGLVAYGWRRLKNGGGPGWNTKHVQNWRGHPEVNRFDFTDAQVLTTGDYAFLVRCQDVLARWGVPETLEVRINYAPYFVSVDYYGEVGGRRPLWIPTAAGAEPETAAVAIVPLAGGDYPGLRVRIEASDNHAPAPDTDPLDPNRVVENETSSVEDYRARLNDARNGYEPATGGILEWTFPVSPDGGQGIVRPGLNVLELAARDMWGRVGVRRVVFRAELLPR